MTFGEYYEEYLKYIDMHNKYFKDKIIPLLPEEAIHLFYGQLIIHGMNNKGVILDWLERNRKIRREGK